MLEINAPSMGNNHFNGEYGNKSAAHLMAILEAAAPNQVFNLGEFSAGTRADDMKVINSALGAGTSLEIGVSYPRSATPNVSTKFMTIAGTSSAKTTRYDGVPIRFDEPFILTATLKGGVGDGSIDIVFDFTFEGI